MSNLFSKVRQTSHKPDEIYGVIERLAPGTRKIGEQLLHVHVCVYSLYRTVCIFCSGKVEVLISGNRHLRYIHRWLPGFLANQQLTSRSRAMFGELIGQRTWSTCQKVVR